MFKEKECFIDCGLNGAIVVIEDDVLTNVIRMPKKGKLIDIERFNTIIKGSRFIVLEQQFNKHKKDGEKAPKGAFTNAENFGGMKWLSFIETNGNIEVVDAKKWKGFHNLLNTPNRSKFLPKIVKVDSIRMANKLFEMDIDVVPSLDGLGDALLIMNYSRRIRKLPFTISIDCNIFTKQ